MTTFSGGEANTIAVLGAWASPHDRERCFRPGDWQGFLAYLRMVQPEDRVEARIGNDTHVTSIPNQAVNGIVHVLQAIVTSTAPV